MGRAHLTALVVLTAAVVAGAAALAGGTSAAPSAATAPTPLRVLGARGSVVVGNGTGATQSLTVSSATTAGDRLIAAVLVRNYAAQLTSVADPRGNTWTTDARISSKAANEALFVVSTTLAAPLRAGDQLLFRFSQAPLDVRAAVAVEVSGLLAVAPDATATALGGGTQMRIPASSQPSGPQTLALSFFGAESPVSTPDPTMKALAGTPLSSTGSVSNRTLFGQFRLLNSFEPVGASGTTERSGSWVGALLLYRAAASSSDMTAPQSPADVRAVATPDGQVRLSWTNPMDPDLARVEVSRGAPSGSNSPTAPGSVVFSGVGAADMNPPFAAGDAAWNIALNRATKRVAIRFVPRASKTLASVYLHVKTSGSGYAAGTAGSCLATLYAVLPNGLPDVSAPVASTEVAVLPNAGGHFVLQLDLNAPVEAGRPYALVLANADPNPAANYFSLNFLAVDQGAQPSLLGAQGRNETSSAAADLYYGLDPREAVGGSADDGKTWHLPGNTDVTEAKWVPTYALRFADGTFQAQPYYSSHQPADGTYTMVYRASQPWTVRQIGAYLYTWGASRATRGSGTVQVLVNDQPKEKVALSGSGFVRNWLPQPIALQAGDVLQLQTTVAAAGGSAGLPLRFEYADTYMSGLVGLGKSSPFYLDLAPYTYALPLFPLPYQNAVYAPPPASALVPGSAGDTFTVVAYDRAGNASAPVVVTTG